MLAWEKNIPDYLTNRKNTVNFILFTAAFALVFINIYFPFGAEKWRNEGNISEVMFFVYSSILILIGMLVIVLSRVLMYLYTIRKAMPYSTYGIWIVAEIVVLAFIYAIIRYFVFKGNDFSLILKNTIRTTAFIIMLPYVISWLYLSFRDKNAELEKIENNRSAFDSSETGESRSALSAMIPFRDEKGVLRFSIKREDVLYLESADNYVVIHYLDHNKLARYIIRNTLKRIEAELPHTGLVRCHRSYMVNIDNVKMIRKEKEGLIIGFNTPVQVSLPITKTYVDYFMKIFSQYPLAES